MAEKPRLKLPKEAKKGDLIEIKTLMPHIMESGQRKDKDGKVIPRKIINKFTCEFNGKPVFSGQSRAGDRGEPVYAVLRQGGRERHVQVHRGPTTTARSPPRKKRSPWAEQPFRAARPRGDGQ